MLVSEVALVLVARVVLVRILVVALMLVFVLDSVITVKKNLCFVVCLVLHMPVNALIIECQYGFSYKDLSPLKLTCVSSRYQGTYANFGSGFYMDGFQSRKKKPHG